jgi:hypothetical protein
MAKVTKLHSLLQVKMLLPPSRVSGNTEVWQRPQSAPAGYGMHVSGATCTLIKIDDDLGRRDVDKRKLCRVCWDVHKKRYKTQTVDFDAVDVLLPPKRSLRADQWSDMLRCSCRESPAKSCVRNYSGDGRDGAIGLWTCARDDVKAVNTTSFLI